MDNVTIIGTGALGRALIKRFQLGGFTVMSFDADKNKSGSENTFEEAVEKADVIFLCIPTRAIKESAQKIGKINSRAIVVSFSKGMTENGKTAAETLNETFVEKNKWVVVGGPMIAEDIYNSTGKIIAAVGSLDSQVGETVANIFKTSGIDVVSNYNPFVVSFMGILKNIYAFGIGALDGFGIPKVEKEAYFKKAIYEMKKFCELENFNAEIVDSPAGKDDLIETGNSLHSRNRQMGFELATTGKIITSGESQSAIAQLARRFPKIVAEMPVLTFLAEVIEGRRPAKEIIDMIK